MRPLPSECREHDGPGPSGSWHRPSMRTDGRTSMGGVTNIVPNTMLDPAAPKPTIVGAFDHDRAAWADPASDWTLFQAGLKPGSEVDAFWQTYGAPGTGDGAAWWALIYRARHLGAIRLERHRMGRADRIPASYPDMWLGRFELGSGFWPRFRALAHSRREWARARFRDGLDAGGQRL